MTPAPAVRSASDGRRTLVLWRHGRTEWNVLGRGQGSTDIPLDEVGVEQARQAAARLASMRPSLLWSSDLSRARATADELAKAAGVTVRDDPRLREMHMGVRQGLTLDQVRERYPQVWEAFQRGVEPPQVEDAETEAQVADRVVAVIEEAVDALGPGEVGVLVSHGISIRVGLMRFLGLPVMSSRVFSGVANCCWVVLEESRFGWRILEYNAGSLPEPVLSDDFAEHDTNA